MTARNPWTLTESEARARAVQAESDRYTDFLATLKRTCHPGMPDDVMLRRIKQRGYSELDIRAFFIMWLRRGVR